jgi:hypothetical protein
VLHYSGIHQSSSRGGANRLHFPLLLLHSDAFLADPSVLALLLFQERARAGVGPAGALPSVRGLPHPHDTFDVLLFQLLADGDAYHGFRTLLGRRCMRELSRRIVYSEWTFQRLSASYSCHLFFLSFLVFLLVQADATNDLGQPVLKNALAISLIAGNIVFALQCIIGSTMRLYVNPDSGLMRLPTIDADVKQASAAADDGSGGFISGIVMRLKGCFELMLKLAP